MKLAPSRRARIPSFLLEAPGFRMKDCHGAFKTRVRAGSGGGVARPGDRPGAAPVRGSGRPGVPLLPRGQGPRPEPPEAGPGAGREAGHRRRPAERRRAVPEPEAGTRGPGRAAAGGPAGARAVRLRSGPRGDGAGRVQLPQYRQTVHHRPLALDHDRPRAGPGEPLPGLPGGAPEPPGRLGHPVRHPAGRLQGLGRTGQPQPGQGFRLGGRGAGEAPDPALPAVPAVRAVPRVGGQGPGPPRRGQGLVRAPGGGRPGGHPAVEMVPGHQPAGVRAHLRAARGGLRRPGHGRGVLPGPAPAHPGPAGAEGPAPGGRGGGADHRPGRRGHPDPVPGAEGGR